VGAEALLITLLPAEMLERRRIKAAAIASIFKDFNMPHESVLSFRAELFNISNTTSFLPPGASPTSSASTSTVDTSTGAQIVNTSVPSRDIQFALKYNF
jgi:hypothetical protein